MRETTQTCLRDIMVIHARAVAQQAGGPTKEQAAQQMFDQLRDDVIRPLMKEFAEALETHGHVCRVYGKPMSVTTPGNVTQNAEIVMTIVPKVGDEAPEVARREYQISFVLAPEEQKIRAIMTHGPRSEPCSTCPHDFHPLEGVTPELIEAELLEMMRHVFAQT